MANPSKQKGTAFETQCLNYLKTWFSHVYRAALSGGKDVGDINGVLREEDGAQVIFQCKNHKAMKLGEWIKATKAQSWHKTMDTLEQTIGVLLVKRRGIGDKNMGRTYAIMELEDLATLLKEAGYK